ncbi:MAG: AMP-binding protein [Nitriliruptorales bacterium]|nr:AMP-binding protein [Nitriliruptorales bacterium]
MQPELIALRLPPGPEFVAAMTKVWSSGDAVLPVPWHAPQAQVEAILHELRPAAIASPRDGEKPGASLRRLPGARPVPHGTGLVLITSGTTDRPKGVELPHSSINSSLQASLRWLGAEKGDRWLVCLPLHHIAGLGAVLRSRRMDAEPIIHERFDVGAIGGETRAAYISLVPTMLHRLLEADVDLSNYKAVLVGGAPLSDQLATEAAERGVNVVRSYGMTETCGGCVYNGEPLSGVEVDVNDGGRIRIRGPVVMRGYRGRADLSGKAFRDGWFITNDLGRIDEDGRLEVLGRVDDVIITGGENVMASVVATALTEVEGVAEAAVVGRPDEEWGQVVAAVVVPSDPEDPPTLDELRRGATHSLPGYALPKELWLVERLPRDGMGKVSRPALEAFVTKARKQAT